MARDKLRARKADLGKHSLGLILALDTQDADRANDAPGQRCWRSSCWCISSLPWPAAIHTPCKFSPAFENWIEAPLKITSAWTMQFGIPADIAQRIDDFAGLLVH